MPGFLYHGGLYSVPGVTVVSPGEDPSCRMEAGDYAPRSSPRAWIRQITIHTTKGTWPQLIRPGSGPSGRAKSVADYWYSSSSHGGAPFVIGSDGIVWCLVDIGKYQTYHATTVNPWSVGIEMYQEADGSIYEATLDSCVKLVLKLCDILGIPFQGSGRTYVENGILQRMLHGGVDVVGVYGHRDNAWDFEHGTSSRGKGDPGNEIFSRLNAASKLNFDIDMREDLAFWSRVQNAINTALGSTSRLSVDGKCGPSTVTALRQLGLWNGGVINPTLFAQI